MFRNNKKGIKIRLKMTSKMKLQQKMRKRKRLNKTIKRLLNKVKRTMNNLKMRKSFWMSKKLKLSKLLMKNQLESNLKCHKMRETISKTRNQVQNHKIIDMDDCLLKYIQTKKHFFKTDDQFIKLLFFVCNWGDESLWILSHLFTSRTFSIFKWICLKNYFLKICWDVSIPSYNSSICSSHYFIYSCN